MTVNQWALTNVFGIVTVTGTSWSWRSSSYKCHTAPDDFQSQIHQPILSNTKQIRQDILHRYKTFIRNYSGWSVPHELGQKRLNYGTQQCIPLPPIVKGVSCHRAFKNKFKQLFLREATDAWYHRWSCYIVILYCYTVILLYCYAVISKLKLKHFQKLLEAVISWSWNTFLTTVESC